MHPQQRAKLNLIRRAFGFFIMRSKIRLLLSVILLAFASVWMLRAVSTPDSKRIGKVQRPKAFQVAKLEQVSAFGYLEPSGDTRVLSAPIQSQDGGPRIKQLNVEEGQNVKALQLLATFDTSDRTESQKQTAKAKIKYLSAQLSLLESETNRYRMLSSTGAIPASEVESRQLNLLKLKSELELARRDLQQINTELSYSKLYSPITGTVITIYARSGERVGLNGVLKVGTIDSMEAVAQVNEDDIKLIRIGQAVRMASQNGGFTQKINGKVIRITPGISTKKQLTLNPTADADSENRAVDVRIKISGKDIGIVRNLTGAKIIATFMN